MSRSKFFITSILALAVVTAVSGRGEQWTANNQEEHRSTSSAPEKTDRPFEVEVVTITPDGFEPQQIVRPPGPFLLAVTNRSGLDSLDVQLATEERGKLREKSLPLTTPRWREVMNLRPGRYVITEANHPEWTFSLIIQ